MNAKQKLSVATAVFILAIILLSCVKERNERAVDVERKTNINNLSGRSLPINIGKYNLLNSSPVTKNKEDPESFALDSSWLNLEKIKQISFDDGVVYTQIPFKINDSSFLAVLSSAQKPPNDSLVTVRCFYIIFEDCVENVKAEYIVTMIPSKYQQRVRNDYDFLDKPNFSGIVLYSNKQGEYIYLETFQNGRICKGQLLTQEEIQQQQNVAYARFYAADAQTHSITKSGENPEYGQAYTLPECIVIAYTDAWDGIPESPLKPTDEPKDVPLEHVDHIERPLNGSAYSPPAKNIKYTLTTMCSGCYNARSTQEYTKGAAIQIRAKYISDTCIFIAWMGSDDAISANTPSIEVKMDKDKTVRAHYVSQSNSECYKLAKLAQDSILRNSISTIRNKDQSREHAFLRKSDNSTDYQTGTDARIKIQFESGVKYSQVFHTHPSGVARVSGSDLLTLYSMLFQKKNVESIQDFSFGVVTQKNIMSLSVVDVEAFNEFFKGHKTSEDFKYFFDKKVRATPSVPYYDMSSVDQNYFNEKMLKEITPLLESMGIRVSFSDAEKDINRNQMNNWKNISVSENIVHYSNCLQ